MHMLQALDRATFNNIEQLSLEFAKYTIRPWVKRWEQEYNRKVFSQYERGRFKVRLNMDAFMRADTEARAEYYNKAIQNGWMSINEVRKTEKLNPVEGGDKHFIQLNMTTIDQPQQPAQNSSEDAV
jgi:HK97 family phage portal protein